MLTISTNIKSVHFKEGIALFNNFTGNTHFLPSLFNSIITALAETSSSRETLFALFLSDSQKNISEINNTKEEFQQFITEALKSGIISEIN